MKCCFPENAIREDFEEKKNIIIIMGLWWMKFPPLWALSNG